MKGKTIANIVTNEKSISLLKSAVKWLERLDNRKEYIKNGFFDIDTDVSPLIKDIRKYLKEQKNERIGLQKY